MKRVLIVGSGGIGRRHLKGYTLTGRAELAIVEPDEGRRREATELFGITEAYSTLGDADLSRFDLAVICAPANFHVALIRQCAAARLPFMVEKPLSVTMDDVDIALAGAGVIPGSGTIAVVGWAGLVALAVALLSAAGEWTPETGWITAFRAVPAAIKADAVGALYLAATAVFVGVVTWALAPLFIAGIGCAALAVVAVPARRRRRA